MVVVAVVVVIVVRAIAAAVLPLFVISRKVSDLLNCGKSDKTKIHQSPPSAHWNEKLRVKRNPVLLTH